MKDRYGTDYGYQNRGGTRARLSEGPITKRHIWNMLPFGNKMVVLKVKGDAVEEYLRQRPSGPANKIYTAATNDYVGDRVISELGLEDDQVVRHPELLRDIVIEYIEKHGLQTYVENEYNTWRISKGQARRRVLRWHLRSRIGKLLDEELDRYDRTYEKY